MQTVLGTGRRYIVLFLPTWATDYLKRHDRDLTGPLALYEHIKGGMRLAAIDRQAAQSGLHLGQSLTDARAMLPSLRVLEIDRALLAYGFADFADWHSNASPMVAVMTDQSAFGDLVLDITGVTHLFGGEAAMLAMLVDRLSQLGYAVSGAIASTIGAAWAVSHFQGNQIVPPEETSAVLSALPVAALRLSQPQISGLSQMGLKRIGQLDARDRKALQARFGLSLLERLDQAHGLLVERMTPRLPLAEHYAEQRFAEPIGLMDDVLLCVNDLAVRLALQLETGGLAAQTFHLFLYRVDHKVMTLSVNSGRPMRDAAHIMRLFKHRSERLEGAYDAGFGIDMIRLAASAISPLSSAQLGIFAGADGAEDLDRLYDRMSSRLGSQAVAQTKFVNTHIPERAAQLAPAILHSPVDDLALPPASLSRPLRLLPMPEAIAVTAQVPDGPPAAMIWRRLRYVFVKASPPERIAVEWQYASQRLDLVPVDDAPEEREKQKPSPLKLVTKPEVPLDRYQEGDVSRDYYIAEDAAGHRFWLYRQGLYGFADHPVWFLHGFFP